jgi:hypothetical protein
MLLQDATVCAFLIAAGLSCNVPSVPARQIEFHQPDNATGGCGGKMCKGTGPIHAPHLITIGQAAVSETPANIISDQIRRQGYPCDEPRQAEHDRQASRPNEAVWVLRCANAAYRVTLIPDMAARVEPVNR